MKNNKLKLLFNLLVFFHHVAIITLIASPILLIMNQPFYVWVPLNIWILHLMFSPVLVCPATIWENRLRRILGKKEIKTFFKHYYIEPLKKFIDEL
tara:strand:- start:201 stop:488 length:288 start_codon:yes stop_codon:yes gene_type:complete